jgi:hypothetical protein
MNISRLENWSELAPNGENAERVLRLTVKPLLNMVGATGFEPATTRPPV